MGVASLDLRAIADAIVALARRAVEQRGELEAQSKRLSLLESAVADVADRRGPPPLQIKRTSSSTAEALTKSFEARLAARPDEDD